jgi:hypothetical protein
MLACPVSFAHMDTMPAPSLITPILLEQAMSSVDYLQLFEDKVAQGATTGANQSAFMVDYTRLNLQRTRRVTQQMQLVPELQAALAQIKQDWVWLLISEIWCGDAAQSLPLMFACEAASAHIDIRIILRDEHPAIMDIFMRGNSRAIPILACLRKDDLGLLGSWGARPRPAQDIMDAHKAKPVKPDAEIYEDMHRWYAHDRTLTQQQEFTTLIGQWAAM